MELFGQLPWWGQIVFIATNAWIIFILGILIRQAVVAHGSQVSNLFEKKETKSASESRERYGHGRSSTYMDA